LQAGNGETEISGKQISSVGLAVTLNLGLDLGKEAVQGVRRRDGSLQRFAFSCRNYLFYRILQPEAVDCALSAQQLHFCGLQIGHQAD
jgi:hypothetical protein